MQNHHIVNNDIDETTTAEVIRLPSTTEFIESTSEFLAAIFPAHRVGEMILEFKPDKPTVVADGMDALTVFLASAAQQPIHASPVTTAGEASFVFEFMENAAPDVWSDFNPPPTAALSKDNQVICVWAFAAPLPAANAAGLFTALRASLDDAIPLPGAGWRLERCAPEARYSLADLEAAFGVEPNPQTPRAALFRDAVICSPFDPEDPRLAREVVLSGAGSAEAPRWRSDRLTIRNALELFSTHRESDHKDGPAQVLGALSGPQRTAKAVERLEFVGLDVDSGFPGDELCRRIGESGLMAVVHSTHSHGTTETREPLDAFVAWGRKECLGDEVTDEAARARLLAKGLLPGIASQATATVERGPKGREVVYSHPPIPKWRVILPLMSPFVIADHATDREGLEAWRRVPQALADMLGLPIDKTGCDPNRLFYLPAHASGRPFEAYIFGGEFFDADAALAGAPVVVERTSGRGEAASGALDKRWAATRADGLQIADLIRDFAGDRVRSGIGDKLTIECPNDSAHSNAGDPSDAGCFVENAGDRGGFRWRCAHNSCRDLDRLALLNMAVEAGWFTVAAVTGHEYDALDRTEEDANRNTEQADGFPLPGRHFGVFDWVTFDGRRFIGRKIKGEPDQPLCSPFAVIGAARYADRDGLRDVEIALANEAGEREVIRIPADTIPRRDTLIALLRGQGMTFADPKQGPALVHRVLMATQPEPRTLYDRPGFLPDGSFLMPTGVVVGADPAKVGLSDRIRIAAPATAGDLDGWKAGAKVACEAESLSLKAALFAGCAGPLLALAGRGTLVLAFTGTTSQGKTWRQQVGVAVSGPPKPGIGQMRSLNSTQNALEAPLERGSSTITAFDETAFADASTVHRLIFLAAGEQGKARLTRDGGEGLSRSWRGGVVTLSTEVGLAQLLRQEGERQSGGMTVRMIEVDVERDGRLSDADFRIANGMLANYGHALPVFLAECRRTGFIDNPGRLTERAEGLIKGLPGIAEAPAHRAALGLGFLGVAAETAKAAGLVPESLDVAAMIQALWSGAMSSGVAPVDPVDRAIAQLVETINARRGTEVFDLLAQEERLNPRDPMREIGCWVDMHEGDRVYLVRDSVLGAWSGGAVDVRTLRAELKAQEYLIAKPKADHAATTWNYWRTPVGRTRVVVLRASLVEGG